MNQSHIDPLRLKQSVFRLHLPGASVIYMDPYLSYNVACVEGPEIWRQYRVVLDPAKIDYANPVMTSHGHIDHCHLGPAVLPSRSAPMAIMLAADTSRLRRVQRGNAGWANTGHGGRNRCMSHA